VWPDEHMYQNRQKKDRPEKGNRILPVSDMHKTKGLKPAPARPTAAPEW